MTKICKIDDCDAPVNARGWCAFHYRRWHATGSVECSCRTCGAEVPDGRMTYCGPECRPVWVNPRKCSINGCGAPSSARGWCSTHYSRWRTTGQPEKLCASCGKVITLRHPGRHTYCSPTCKPRCTVADCGKPIRGRAEKYCATHGRQAVKTGELPRVIGTPWAEKGGQCAVCDSPVPANSGRRRVCSDACQQRLSHHHGDRPRTFECKGCKGQFSISERETTGKLRRSDTQWCTSCLDESVRHRLYRYSVTPEQYAAAIIAGCEICGSTDRKLHIDHDHNCCPGDYTCGKCVRGFLCGPCNRAIGMLQDSPDHCVAAAAYILKGIDVIDSAATSSGGALFPNY